MALLGLKGKQEEHLTYAPVRAISCRLECRCRKKKQNKKYVNAQVPRQKTRLERAKQNGKQTVNKRRQRQYAHVHAASMDGWMAVADLYMGLNEHYYSAGIMEVRFVRIPTGK